MDDQSTNQSGTMNEDQLKNAPSPSVDDELLTITPLVSADPVVIQEAPQKQEAFVVETPVSNQEIPQKQEASVAEVAPVVEQENVPVVKQEIAPVEGQEAPQKSEALVDEVSPVAVQEVSPVAEQEVPPVQTSPAPAPVAVKAFSKGGFSKIIRAAVLFLIAGSMFSGNIFWDNYLANANKNISQKFEGFNYNEVNNIPDRGVMRFSSTQNGQAPSMETILANDKNEYVFNLKNGIVWGNFSVSDSKINILANRVVVIPNRASFNLSFDGNNIYLYVYKGDVYVGFLPDSVNVTEYQDEYSNIFMNRMLVPKGAQITIPLHKIDDKLKLLLYSRLVGEFRYSLIPDSVKEEEWVLENLKRDRKYLENLKQDFTSKILRDGRASMDGKLNRFVYWIEENLSFVPDRHQEIILSHLFAYLDDAIFYAVDEDKTNMESSLSEFNKYYLSHQSLISGSDLYDKMIDEYIKRLMVFDSNDPEYKVLEFILDMKFSEDKNVYEIVNRFWVNVYDVIESTDTAIDQALDFYYSYLKKTLTKKSDLGYYRMYIAYQNQLFDNLFLNYPVFYKDTYFAMKSTLEKEMISLYEEGQLKNELSQDLINEKIELLKRLMKFFFDEEVEVEDAKLILSRLIEEINGLMDPSKAQDAVVSLFESQLKSVVDFWGYLKSPEYYSSKAYGINHKERFQSYLKEREKIWSFINIQEDILGVNSEKHMTIEDVVKEVQGVITKNKSITNIEIGRIDDVNQRDVEIRASIDEFPFEATYDRSQQVIKNIKVNGDIISVDPIKIDSLMTLIEEKYGVKALQDIDANNGENTDQQLAVETNAQRIARIYISKKIQETGFEITDKNVQLIDEANTVYRITDAYIKGDENVLVTFDYTFKLEKTNNIFFTFEGKPIVVQGEYSLEDIYNMIIKGVDKEFSENIENGQGESQSKPLSRKKSST